MDKYFYTASTIYTSVIVRSLHFCVFVRSHTNSLLVKGEIPCIAIYVSPPFA